VRPGTERRDESDILSVETDVVSHEDAPMKKPYPSGAGRSERRAEALARQHPRAGRVADLDVYEGMSHAGYVFGLRAPESHQVYGELAAFLKQHLK